MLRTTLFIILLSTQLFLSCPLLAQQAIVEHLTIENGLPENSAFAMIQDHLGFIWLGTQFGLVRYDGLEMKTYRIQDDQPGAQSNLMIIWSIMEDRRGDLWIGTQGVHGELIRFDRAAECFVRYSSDLENNLTIFGFIQEDRAGNIWTGSYLPGLGDFPLYVLECDQRGSFPNDLREAADSINYLVVAGLRRQAFCEDQAGAIWIGAGERGLWRIDSATLAVSPYQPETDAQRLLSNHKVISIFEDKEQHLWVGTEGGGLIRLGPDRKSVEYFLTNETAAMFLQANDGTLWGYVVNKGLFQFEPEKGSFSPLKIPNVQPASWVFPLAADDQNRLWLMSEAGDRGADLHLFDTRTSAFYHYFDRPNDPAAFHSGLPRRSFLLDRSGVFWVGTWRSGLNKIDLFRQRFRDYQPGVLKSGRFIHFQPETAWFHRTKFAHRGAITIYEDENGLLSTGPELYWDHPDSLFWNAHACKDSLGQWWMPLTGQTGLFRFDTGTKTYRRYLNDPDDPGSLSNDEVTGVAGHSPGQVWVTTQNGLNRLDIETEHFTRFYSTQGSRFLWLKKDGSGSLWMGGSSHLTLVKFDVSSEEFIHYPGFANALDVLEDRRGRFWVGSYFDGLTLFDRKAGRILRRYGLEDGLPNLSVGPLLEDEKGNLWFKTANGLSHFDPTTQRFRNYDTSYGSNWNQGVVNSQAYFPAGKNAAGAFFFVMGLENDRPLTSTFFPEAVRDNPYPPAVALTGLRLNGEPVAVGQDGPLKEDLSITPSLLLTYQQNDFSIEYTALHFSRPEANQFAYKLEPYERQWRQVGTQRGATYTNLSPGKYVFRVKASNSDGVWNEEGASLHIVIAPPWWRTNAAYLSYLLLFVAIIWAFIRWRLYVIRLHYERETAFAKASAAEEANEAKSNFLSVVSHELRTPLTSIIGFARILKNRLEERIFPQIEDPDQKTKKTIEQASANLNIIVAEGERLTNLINELLDLAKIEAGKMEWKMESINPADLIERAMAATAALFQQKPKLQLIREVPENRPTLTGDRDRLLQVLINLISNAVKFTDSGVVRLGLELSPAGGGGGVEIPEYGNTPLHGNTVSVLHPTPSRGISEPFASGKKAGRELIFSVADTGSGIPPEHQDQIFEKFKQVEDNQSGKPKGTGLGLPICKEIVEHHGGRIWVESPIAGMEGRGSKFYFTVPL